MGSREGQGVGQWLVTAPGETLSLDNELQTLIDLLQVFIELIKPVPQGMAQHNEGKGKQDSDSVQGHYGISSIDRLVIIPGIGSGTIPWIVSPVLLGWGRPWCMEGFLWRLT